MVEQKRFIISAPGEGREAIRPYLEADHGGAKDLEATHNQADRRFGGIEEKDLINICFVKKVLTLGMRTSYFRRTSLLLISWFQLVIKQAILAISTGSEPLSLCSSSPLFKRLDSTTYFTTNKCQQIFLLCS